MKDLLKETALTLMILLAVLSCNKEDELPAGMINYTTKNGLFDNYVNNIVVDTKGNVLVGCGSAFSEDGHYEGGLSKFDGQKWVTYHVSDGLAMDWILSMAMDQQGVCWIGTNGKGVSKFDGTHWTTYTRADGLSNNYVSSVAVDKQGNKWFGSYALNKFDGTHWKTYGTDQVMAIMPDTLGNIWLGTGSVGLWKLDKEEKLSCTVVTGKEYNGFIMAIAIDKQGNKWCTNGRGVSKLDGAGWTTYTTQEGLSNDEVFCIVADPLGGVWVGTANGLCRFDGQHWTNYLPGKIVQTIAIDAMGNKWIGTMGHGVFKWKN